MIKTKQVRHLSYKSLYQYGKNMIKKIPFIRSLQELEYERHFSGKCYGCSRGIFKTFEEAIISAPKTKNIGYDDEELAKQYGKKLKKTIDSHGHPAIASYDYPVLFWLKELLKESTTVFDFGGNLGIHFYAYEKYLSYPLDFKWVVCEVPAIIKAGQALAEEEKKSALIFTNSFEEANGTDIFLASGSIQYIESIITSLTNLAIKPKHIIINRLPLYDGEQFVSLQNGGKVFYPYYVFNNKEFIESICEVGYQLIDIWEDRVGSCKIPFYPEKSVRFWSGLYFRLGE